MAYAIAIQFFKCQGVETRDVEAEAGIGSGLFSVEAEARKTCRFRFHISYLT